MLTLGCGIGNIFLLRSVLCSHAPKWQEQVLNIWCVRNALVPGLQDYVIPFFVPSYRCLKFCHYCLLTDSRILDNYALSHRVAIYFSEIEMVLILSKNVRHPTKQYVVQKKAVILCWKMCHTYFFLLQWEGIVSLFLISLKWHLSNVCTNTSAILCPLVRNCL